MKEMRTERAPSKVVDGHHEGDENPKKLKQEWSMVIMKEMKTRKSSSKSGRWSS
ncbi:hypothetical protein [Bacillus dakarensis]|uniref:hypothetical protein n=1 Tax=Robertmurraya dakarensis TaxID=1926278 RepID=UPI0012B6888E|nr:hypothetical protein [Bacillus dakarensis]